MILYGTITDESVGKLFMSGVVPGALLTLAFVATSSLLPGTNPGKKGLPMKPR